MICRTRLPLSRKAQATSASRRRRLCASSRPPPRPSVQNSDARARPACVPAVSGKNRTSTSELKCHARIRLPVGADLPTDDEALCGLPDEHVAHDRLRAVLALRVPAPADKRLDDRFPDRRSADAMGLRPPAIDLGGEHLESPFGSCLHDDGFAHRRDTDCSIQGFFLPRDVSGSFHFVLERLQRVIPKLIEPAAQLAEAVRIDVIDAPRAGGAIESPSPPASAP